MVAAIMIFVVLITGAFIGFSLSGKQIVININHNYPEKPEEREPEQYNRSYGDPTIKNYLDKQFGGVNNE